MREVQDHYNRLAKQEGFRARAAYKLIDIDDRKKILRSGDAVLDCGAWPGSWLQVAAKRVGPRGCVVGIDLEEMKRADLPANVHLVTGDFTAVDPRELLKFLGPSSQRLFDVILSDMAPNTTGDRSIDHFGSVRLCDAVLDRCPALLRPDGSLVLKVFEGESYMELLRRVGRVFESAKGYKPKASRSESMEMYVIATGHHPGIGAPAEKDAAPVRKRSTGWA